MFSLFFPCDFVYFSLRKCPGVEGKVCGRFLPSKEHDPHQLCVACRGKSCHPDDRCDECHEWLEERCKSVLEYVEKLSLQHERKKVKKTKSSSSFPGFSPSMPVPLGLLPSSADSGVVAASASSSAECAVTFAVADLAVTTALLASMHAVQVAEHPRKRLCVTDPKELELMLANFEDWWASGRSTPRLGPSSAAQPPLVTPLVVPVLGLSTAVAIPAVATLLVILAAGGVFFPLSVAVPLP